MTPIATISLLTADQLSCRLAAADDHAWPECASTAPNDHSSPLRVSAHKTIAAIICPFATPRHSDRHPNRRPLHRWTQPNPHNAR